MLVVKALPLLDTHLIQLAHSGDFLRAVGKYLGSTKPPVRMAGMYIAEIVSKKTVDPKSGTKPLDFGDAWDENNEGFPYVQRLRDLMDAPADSEAQGWQLPDMDEGQVEEVEETVATSSHSTSIQATASSAGSKQQSKASSKIQLITSLSEFEDYDKDADDDLQPYALPKMPDASELADIDDMATYKSEKNKVKPPVYIPELSAYLKSSEDAEKLKMGLREAESLIRRKASWGFEIREREAVVICRCLLALAGDAAIDLAITLVGLQDNFELEGFDEQRLAALSALNTSAPLRSVP